MYNFSFSISAFKPMGVEFQLLLQNVVLQFTLDSLSRIIPKKVYFLTHEIEKKYPFYIKFEITILELFLNTRCKNKHVSSMHVISQSRRQFKEQK